jgi:hypothetical protein
VVGDVEEGETGLAELEECWSKCLVEVEEMELLPERVMGRKALEHRTSEAVVRDPILIRTESLPKSDEFQVLWK